MLRRLLLAAVLAALVPSVARADYFYKTASGKCSPGEEPKKRGSSAACVPAPGHGGNCPKGRKIEHYDRLDMPVCVDDPNGAKAPAAAKKPLIQTKSGSCHSNEEYVDGSPKAWCKPSGGRCGSLRAMVAAPTGSGKMCIDK